MKRFKDLQIEIEKIEIRKEFVFIHFKDKFRCEIPQPHTESRYCGKRCSNIDTNCPIHHDDFVDLWDNVIQKHLDHECILIPDWASKVTGCSRGWEEIKYGGTI